jgi:Protein of unknown function (DUF551)
MEWILVSERLPELPPPYAEGDYMVRPVTSRCLVYDGEGVYEESFDEHGFTFDGITHWMPLPEPPKQ